MNTLSKKSLALAIFTLSPAFQPRPGSSAQPATTEAALFAITNPGISRELKVLSVDSLGNAKNRQNPAVLQALSQIVSRDPDWLVRAVAAWSLGDIRNAEPRVLSVLCKALSGDEHPKVRLASAMALGSIREGDKKVLKSLKKASSKDSSKLVRAKAAQALQRISTASKPSLPGTITLSRR